MTETEFGTRCQEVGIEQGRMQVAMELSKWVVNHPALPTNPVAADLARDLLKKCQEIVWAVGNEAHRKRNEYEVL